MESFNSLFGKGITDSERAAREILNYSFQKDSYQGQQVNGDYLIAYLVEKARWLRYSRPGAPEVSKPDHKNAYIGIAVHRLSDMRFITNLDVYLTILDRSGISYGKHQLQYHPRPGLHHYGLNWLLPGSDQYTLRVVVEGLDRENKATATAMHAPQIVVAAFHNVLIQTGVQIS